MSHSCQDRLQQDIHQLPTAWIVHDKLMKDINSSKLGQSYGFQATCIFSNSIDNITKTVDKTYSDLEFEQTPDAIVLKRAK